MDYRVLQILKDVLEILRPSATPLSYPQDTPASKAYFALSSLYVSLLLADKKDDDWHHDGY